MDRLRQIILIVILGSLAGLTTFRLASEGKLPIKIGNLVPQTINNQTQTVVQEENSVIKVVEQSSPSVVAIGVTQRVANPFDPYALPKQQQSTIGTGFMVSQDKGIIVTNRHVVDNLSLKYTVITKDGKKFDVKKIYRDPNLDLALVQVDNINLPALELGDSSKIRVGQLAIAIGNALGRFDNTVTTGVVSGLGRAVSVGDPFGGITEQLDDLIQTDAAINPGNSGGPLLNSAGQVIGVNVATTEGAQNIGFAIPINSVKAIVDEFVSTGKITRAYMGIRYRLVTRDIAILNEVPQGAYIQEVITGSPADKAGILAGDILTKIDGQTINNETKISQIVQSKKPGDSISTEVWTDGKTRSVNVTLAETPNQEPY
ncbi:hypothetical protein A2631_00830 [Candidatus Daviesbacteria bacterium RIFCSPHIGHO2_01_FULL_44_29]|uniref:PDZ domain-containing protein n=1 Tax=Candidatus Daviesbacteria bacterium RIFCSPHIGHO2_02_FULL_43_12 TaxID=1797776 RepID=A0A1F5KHF7_9BACT|nr:MAG: hypothetical protein A2631_00830 [Candidatus Daviesbacteria bacterium RIFCSPHIGHO2_01_FULL_44_29]OGE40264.1 MAG: hypothetical protein A3D25_05295 [Candidatus Daviesbacteria bacterium RIFCSPHIGHO2_02_FULL_43_12]OGE69063.1 MAG: hypothetical protein A3B55_02375 [Candidatus Daviesbacteria bacterium RIFCSPLOWO2_01_FULL_43_15]